KMGATTIWELWHYETGPGMNSHNHPALGFVSGWFYEALAGLMPRGDAPGWKHIIVKPGVVGDLKWARARVETVRGVVASDWRRTEEGLVLSVTIPANSFAEVFLPKMGKSECLVREGEKYVWRNHIFTPTEGVRSGMDLGDWIKFEVGAGCYRFELE
ncbi:MAG: alpha-L-rhamnosidase C-terminal domain-containing protein, partial [Armatimonadota bacterium]